MFILDKKVINAASMAGSLDSGPIPLGECDGVSVHAVCTGSPVGSLVISAANDKDMTFVALDTSSISAATALLRQIDNTDYKFLKVTYTRTSGTGSLTVHVFGKE